MVSKPELMDDGLVNLTATHLKKKKKKCKALTQVTSLSGVSWCLDNTKLHIIN